MDFNARVSMAEVYDADSGTSEDLKKLLNKMLRDSKNLEYRDQIYFALGNIAMEEGEKEKAMGYYQLSVSTSVQNQYLANPLKLIIRDLLQRFFIICIIIVNVYRQ